MGCRKRLDVMSPPSLGWTGFVLPPRKDAPDGERQMDGIQHSPAEQTRRNIKREPGDVPNGPQVETEDVLPDVQNRSYEADEREDPLKSRHHVKSPFLHICANLGSRRRKCLMTSSGLTHFPCRREARFPAGR